MPRPGLAMLFALATSNVLASTDIYRCVQDDGAVAFQEMPCDAGDAVEDAGADEDSRSSEAPRDEDEVMDFVNPFDEPAETEVPPESPRSAPLSRDRAECEKTTRDAIDAIDDEMRVTRYSKEQGQAYLAELLALTKQLRECKGL